MTTTTCIPRLVPAETRIYNTKSQKISKLNQAERKRLVPKTVSVIIVSCITGNFIDRYLLIRHDNEWGKRTRFPSYWWTRWSVCAGCRIWSDKFSFRRHRGVLSSLVGPISWAHFYILPRVICEDYLPFLCRALICRPICSIIGTR